MTAYLNLFGPDGYKVVRGLLSPQMVKTVRAHLDNLGYSPSPKGEQAPNPEFSFVLHTAVRRSPVMQAGWLGQLSSSFIQYLGADIDLLSSTAVKKRACGTTNLSWHQDEVALSMSSMPILVGIIALDDINEKEGCVHVIPGSHLTGLRPHRVTEAGFACEDGSIIGVPVPLACGDAVFFSQRLVHRGGINRSGRDVVDISILLGVPNPLLKPTPMVRNNSVMVTS